MNPIISAAVAIFVVQSTKPIGETRLSFWLDINYPKLILGYSFTIFAIMSIKSEPTWAADMVYDVLSIQWTIFGLSLAIFLAWNVIVVEFLKKEQPKGPSSDDLFQKNIAALKKKSFLQEAETVFSSIIMLTVNLYLLLLSTSFIYIIGKPESIITQNILSCSFFFTTNSIAGLFLDILRPLKKERAEMLKHNNVTKEDIDKAQGALFAQGIIDALKEKVMSMDSEKYTEEEKKRLFVVFLRALTDDLKNKEAVDSEKQKE